MPLTCYLMRICGLIVLPQNPQCDLQAQDRCHRIGQSNPVVVYRLVAGGSVDQKIVERATAKRKLEKIIIHKGLSQVFFFKVSGKLLLANLCDR